jgi:hypothetical protein
MTVQTACEILKDTSASEELQLQAWDFLHPVVGENKATARAAASPSAPAPMATTPQPAPAPSHVAFDAPASAAPIPLAAPMAQAAPAPGPKTYCCLVYGVAVRCGGQFEDSWEIVYRQEASRFATRADAEEAAAPLRAIALGIRCVELTPGEIRSSEKPAAAPERGRRLLTWPKPAPAQAPGPLGNTWIILCDGVATRNTSTLHDYHCEAAARRHADICMSLESAARQTDGVRKRAEDTKYVLLSPDELAVHQALPKPANGLSGHALHKPARICIVIIGGSPVSFLPTGVFKDFIPCSRLEATQWPDDVSAWRGTDLVRSSGKKVVIDQLSDEEILAAKPIVHEPFQFGQGKMPPPFTSNQPAPLTKPFRRSDQYA